MISNFQIRTTEMIRIVLHLLS